MELSNVASTAANRLIPVIGIEFEPESYSKDKSNYSRTAICAYYKAEARGFEPGHEIEDWLATEEEASQ